MRRIILIITSLFIYSAFALADKLEDRYVMKIFDEGQLYFILPFEIQTQTNKVKPLSVDITYLTTADSITMNMSVLTMKELNTDSVVLEGENKVVIPDFQTFFIEKEGKYWFHRYSIQIPYCQFMQFYSATKPLHIEIHSATQCIQYGYTQTQWNKDRIWMLQIIKIMENNKRLLNNKR